MAQAKPSGPQVTQLKSVDQLRDHQKQQSAKQSQPRTVARAPGTPYQIFVVGAPRPGIRDLYHGFLRIEWYWAFAAIVAGYLALNAVFAALYLATGGIANTEPGSFLDAYFFSVQTMGTIGYGTMYPATRLANALVVAESVTGLIVTALATGMVFVRFSQPKGRVIFSDRACVAPLDGIPTLMVRIGNERANEIFDVEMRMVLMRATRSAEGIAMYRSHDLTLVRSRAGALTRSFTLLHRVDAQSPLFGMTPEALAAVEGELSVSLSGTDDTSLQPVHARKTYQHGDVAWGARLADMLSETPTGDLLVNVGHFHALLPTEPSAAFPYPRPIAALQQAPSDEKQN